MSSVLNRTTKEFLQSVHEPDYPTSIWIHNPDLSSVVGVDPRYWVVVGNVISEMTAAEKDSNYLVTVQKEKMEIIDQRTRELIEQGFEYPAASGQILSLSAEMQRTLEGLHQAKDDPAVIYPIEWNFKDNSGKLALVSAADVGAFYLTALGTVRAHRDAGTALKDSIRTATTIVAVEAIVDNR